VDGERPYESGVFYCKDAFEGLETMDVLQDPARRGPFVQGNLDAARNDVFLHTTVGKETLGGDAGGGAQRGAQRRAGAGRALLRRAGAARHPLPEVLSLLDLDELFRLQWGGRGSGPEYQTAVREEFEPALRRLSAEAIAEGWIKPQAVYGYFPAQSDGNDLVVYDPAAYAATPSRSRRSRASTSRGRRGASGCASPTTSAASRAAWWTWWRCRW
jgi:5-methyltetrahydrofolate--homocysteine methyltransferase